MAFFPLFFSYDALALVFVVVDDDDDEFFSENY